MTWLTFSLPQYHIIAWSVYQTFIQSPWSFQFSNSSANLTISNPSRTTNYNLETVKNESILALAIFFSLLADWVTDTWCIWIKYLLYMGVISFLTTYKSWNWKKNKCIYKDYFRNMPMILNLFSRHIDCTNACVKQWKKTPIFSYKGVNSKYFP